MADGLLDNARKAYERREQLGDVWDWIQTGGDNKKDTAKVRMERADAAARFAGNRKEQAKERDERLKWEHAQEVYRSERDRLEKIVKKQEASQHDDDVDWALGAPHWGGMRDFFNQEIYPIADRMGMVHDDDDKEYGHAVGGDHDPNVTNAFAEDFPTFSGAAFAAAVAAHLGHSGGWSGTYSFIYYKWMGVTVRVQILWAVAGHYNHVHIGARRA